MTSPQASTSSHPALGNVIEICIATRSLSQTIAELTSFGITPWKVYTFDTHDNIRNGTIEGRPAHFRLKVAFAQLTKDIAYEIIEPINADTANGGSHDIFSPWLLTRNGHSGVHHIAYDLNGVPWEERMKRFEDLGIEFVQGGIWIGKRGTCRFAWFRKARGSVEREDLGETSTFFETILFSDDWEDPEPDSIA